MFSKTHQQLVGLVGRVLSNGYFFFKSLDISGSEFGKTRSWMRIAKLWTPQQRRWKWPWGFGGQHHHVTWVEAALEGNSPDGAGPSHSLDQRYQGGLICIKLFLYNHNYMLLYIYVYAYIYLYRISLQYPYSVIFNPYPCFWLGSLYWEGFSSSFAMGYQPT